MARAFGGRSVLREIVETVVLALVVFLVLNVTTARFRVQGLSMEPTLHDGQYLLISRVSYWFNAPQRGDIVVFRPSTQPEDDFIKRILGLPGENVRIEAGQISIDGVPLEEPYVVDRGPYSGDWTLGEGEYFVMGDNRVNSNDSRSWGPLPDANMVGKAWVSYWPPENWSLVAHHTFERPVDEES
jgi:signal peptidase I